MNTYSIKMPAMAMAGALAVCLAATSAVGQPSQALGAPATAAAQVSPTVKAILDRGYLICGSGHATTGFSAPDKNGAWKGLDVETCRAVAIAVLGDGSKTRFVPLTGQQRLTALQTGQIDLLPRTTSW